VLLLLAAGCAPDTGSDPDAVRAVVERAAAARDAGDFAAFTACFSGDVAGRYRRDLRMTHGDDPRRFFAAKRTMVVTGPVSLRRQAFATVGVFVEDALGAKPWIEVGVVFREGTWQVDSFVPGDLGEPRTTSADLDGILALLQREASDPRPADRGSFRRIQLQRALEVVAVRRPLRAAAPLAALLREDPSGGVRQFAASILGEMGATAEVEALRAALDDADLRVRGDAAQALSRLSDEESVERLRVLAATDSSPWVQRRAQDSVASLGGRPAP
jgi:hypothetical protein